MPFLSFENLTNNILIPHVLIKGAPHRVHNAVTNSSRWERAESTSKENDLGGLGKMNPGLKVTTVIVLALVLVHVQMLFEKTFRSSVNYSSVREGLTDEIVEGHFLKASEYLYR